MIPACVLVRLNVRYSVFVRALERVRAYPCALVRVGPIVKTSGGISHREARVTSNMTDFGSIHGKARGSWFHVDG